VAPETLALMTELSAGEELLTLSAERIWRETEKALCERSPEVYFDVLRQCGALSVLLPEVDNLFGVPQNPVSHPEVDTGVHSLLVLQQAAKLSDDSAVRYAALVHDVGKAVTAEALLPSHPGHEKASLALLEALQQRIKVPNRHAELAKIVALYHTCLHGLASRSANEIQTMLTSIGIYRQGGFLQEFLVCCEADHRGRTGFERTPYPQAAWLLELADACQRLNSQQIIEQGYSGAEIGRQSRLQREAIIDKFLLTIA